MQARWRFRLCFGCRARITQLLYVAAKRRIADLLYAGAKSSEELTQCRRAMAAHSRLLVMERVLPPGNMPSLGKRGDITMLVHYGALERTEAEYRVLLEAAGCRLERIIPTQAGVSILEGVPA